MAEIHINPFKVNEYIIQLQQMTNKLQEISVHNSQTLSELNEHWDDEKYHEFKKSISKINDKIMEDIFLLEDKIAESMKKFQKSKHTFL